jgi:hypothetical protein
MQPNILKNPTAKVPWSVIDPLSEEDSAARMYPLIRQPKPILDRNLEIEFLDLGVKVFRSRSADRRRRTYAVPER